MSEFLPQPNPEHERLKGLNQIIENYMPDDAEFLAGMDEEDMLSYVYGQLLEMGEDPDDVLNEFGVTE